VTAHLSSAREPVVLLRENWSAFPAGPLHRDNSARGEYMALTAPFNPGGWFHADKATCGNPDRMHSPLRVARRGRRSRLVKDAATTAWGGGLVLTRGPAPWADYTLTVELAVAGPQPVGLVVRYRSCRDFYAAVFEGGTFKLLRVLEGLPTVLASAPMTPPRRTALVSLRVCGDRLTARAAGVALTARDAGIDAGGVGLWADGPAAFGALTVRAAASEALRLAQAARRETVRLARARRRWPAMELVADIAVRGHAVGRQLRLADLDGDGRAEFLFGIPGGHAGRRWAYQKLARLSALDLEGRVLWERGRPAPDSDAITRDLPFQAADRGRGMEVVAAFGPSLEVLDPLTGKTRQRAPTPVPPRMEPYWEELSQYWGDGHGDDLPRLIPDSLRLCNLTGRHPLGDVLLKDRYHCAWALDGRTLRGLWAHRCNTGHFPFACDLDATGFDTVILGYSRLDHQGRLVGRLVLGDHPDASFAYRDRYGVRHILHPCGEAGFVDERSDGKVEEIHLGHVQHLSVADFDPQRPGLERIVTTFHGNEGIIALLDEQNRLVRKTERYAAGAVCQPVNWTGDGRELIAFSPRPGDGGLWDERFDLVVPFPGGPRPAKYLEVHDLLGLGVDQLVVWDEERLHVYAPACRPRPGRRCYAPLRSWPNTSNYQVNYSLPAWRSARGAATDAGTGTKG
jgi:rhamnogalacturonan endolyase